MKFDFCIGNPPYQDETLGDNKGFAPPVYHKFLESAYQIAENVEMIHPARFLFNAGSTPKQWNEAMLNDEHLKVNFFEQDSSKVFSNTDIKGGVAITYHSSQEKYGAIKAFSPYKELNYIIKKAASTNIENSLSSIMYNQTRFDLERLYEVHPEIKSVIGSNGKDRRFRNNIFDKIDLFTETRNSEDDIAVLGVVKNKRQWRYFPKEFVDQTHENLFKWKALVVRVNGLGVLGETLSTPLISEPNEGYTQTFIGIGAFDTQDEAENALKYVKSKFARTLLGVLKITQDNSIETWKMIPLQDFSPSSDIDWSVSVTEIDLQLYKKYGLAQEEIDFIEEKIKEMV